MDAPRETPDLIVKSAADATALLHDAITKGDKAPFADALNSGADIHALYHHQSALLRAANHHQYEMMKMLMDFPREQPLDVAIRSRFGYTVLQLLVLDYLAIEDDLTKSLIKSLIGQIFAADPNLDKAQDRHQKTVYDYLKAQPNGELTALFAASKREASRSRGLLGVTLGAVSKPNRALLKAAHDGNVNAAANALQAGANINSRDVGLRWGNYTPLIIASYHGYAKFVHFLCHYEAQTVNHFAATHLNDSANTALSWAVRQDHIDVVAVLIDNDPRAMFQRGEKGYNPLHVAAELGHLQIVQVLLAKGGEALLSTVATLSGWNAYRIALASSKLDVANFCIKFLAQEAVCEEKRRASLSRSSTMYRVESSGSWSEASGDESDESHIATQALIGAKPAQSNSTIQLLFGKNNVPDQQLLTAAKEGDLEGVVQALQAGANVNVRSTGTVLGNYTALTLASRFGHKPIVEYLLSDRHGQLVDAKAQTHVNNIRNTALHWAARQGYADIVRMLCDYDPSAIYMVEDEYGNTPLHWAALNGHLHATRCLIEYGGLPLIFHVDRSNYRTPLHVSLLKNHCHVAKFLLVYVMNHLTEKNPVRTSGVFQPSHPIRVPKGLLHAQRDAPIDAVILLSKYRSKQTRNLLTAAKSGDLEGLKVALNRGASPARRETGVSFSNYTALIYAARFGSEEIVQHLLQLLMVIDTKARTYLNNKRNTALHWAAREGHLGCVRSLLQYDCSPLFMHEDEFGNTPLHWAAAEGHLEVVKVLIAWGGVHLIAQTANDGITTAHRLALRKRQTAVAKYIRDYLVNQSASNAAVLVPKHIVASTVAFHFIFDTVTKHLTGHAHRQEIVNNLIRANPQELKILVDILNCVEVDERQMKNVFNGGQIHIPDNGALFFQWVQFFHKTYRQNKSSHQSDDAQHSIQGPLVKECLFGTRTVEIDGNQEKVTWVQLESHPTGLVHLAGHMASYVRYRQTGMNQGPYGASEHTDVYPHHVRRSPSPASDLADGFVLI